VKQSDMTDEEIDAHAKKIAQQMCDAVNDDNKANSEGRPALNKLMLLDSVNRDLRKLAI
jgi:hypothetical protein